MDNSTKDSLKATYETAGLEAGLQIWQIVKFELVPVPKEQHGNFYSGDCYIILSTVLEPTKSQNLHFWIGKESSQDEYAAAAIITMQMDTHLDDLPVQFREVQGRESVSFQKYFEVRGGIKYKKGGAASGFVHTEINEDNENRLLHVKGRRTIYATEVDFSWDSVTSDDVFIFEIGSDIYRWRGPTANMFEWRQSDILCKSIRDIDQGGRGEVYSLLSNSPWPEAITDLLGKAPEEFAASGLNDKKVKAPTPFLYKISQDTGSLKITQVAQAPKIDRDILETDDCYLLDDGENGTIYVWKGQTATLEERKASMSSAIKFIENKGYNMCSVEVYPQGSESEMFWQFFSA